MANTSWTLTEEQKREVVAMRRKGYSLAQLSAHFGVGASAIQHHCARAGVHPPYWRGNWRAKLDNAKARQLRLLVLEEGYTRKKAAETLGVSPEIVGRVVAGREYPYAGGPTTAPIPWSDRECVRCGLLLPEYHKGPLCMLCGRGDGC